VAAQNVTIQIDRSVLDVDISGGPRALTTPQITAWIERSGRAVAAVLGDFPVSRLRMFVRVTGGSGVHGGRTNGTTPPTIRISVGGNSDEETFHKDWIMVHEMIHLMMPTLEDQYHWMEEGLATYVEPIARTRAGIMTVQEFWFETARDMPQGLPEDGDSGFNNNGGWAATYWGGALFWFLADVQIRQETGGKKSLDDALRGIHAEGVDISDDWPVNRVLATGDRATGTDVLERLYEEWGPKKGSVDLEAVFRRLGVIRRGHTVTFDDNAPLAALRKAITRPNPGKR
jgi:hypothetical protein